MSDIQRFRPGDIVVPRDKVEDWKRWGLSVTEQDPDGTLHAAPVGGGMVYRFPPERIRHYDFILVPKDIHSRKRWDPQSPAPPKPRWYKTKFYAEWLDKWFTAWTDGSLWNGWGTPRFELKEGKRYARASQKSSDKAMKTWYDESRDAFVTDESGEGIEEEFAVDKAIKITADGKRIKVYPIGAFSWIWQEREPS